MICKIRRRTDDLWKRWAMPCVEWPWFTFYSTPGNSSWMIKDHIESFTLWYAPYNGLWFVEITHLYGTLRLRIVWCLGVLISIRRTSRMVMTSNWITFAMLLISEILLTCSLHNNARWTCAISTIEINEIYWGNKIINSMHRWVYHIWNFKQIGRGQYTIQ